MENKMLIKINKLNKSYSMGNNTIQVLKDLDLSVKQGECIAIVGESGIGKSTLLNIIGTIDRPDEGSFHFLGEDVLSMNDLSLSSFRNRNIGFVFQAMYLLQEFTALENVIIPAMISGIKKDVAKDYALQILRKFNLDERQSHRPTELSGGERQRIAIARAIINNPKLILADEPTGNLDEKNSGTVIDNIIKLNREYGLSIILVTHNNHLAKKMDLVYILENGQLKRLD